MQRYGTAVCACFVSCVQIWLPNMNQLEGADEKMMLVATARCLSELPPLQANTPLWSGLKDAAYKQLEGELHCTGWGLVEIECKCL